MIGWKKWEDSRGEDWERECGRKKMREKDGQSQF